ncbi:MAG: apolipoprotein N-acyltransferase [Candidatus Omnitrophica bacterium]|nr:apolipoprotein N-acyltransferase [Candidatus Omnitrophota bacterium]
MFRRARSFLLVFLSAALLVLPYHIGACWPLAFFAFVPYFFSLGNRPPLGVFTHSFLFGSLFYIFLGYWLTHVSVLGFALMTLYLALYFGVFGHYAAGFLNPSVEFAGALFPKNMKSVFFTASVWALLEYLRGWLIGGIPWALLAYTQWKNIPFIQIADLVGPYGVSFFVMAVNVLVFKILKALLAKTRAAAALPEEAAYSRRYVSRLFWVLAGLIFALGAYGWANLSLRDSFDRKDPDRKSVLRVSVVQGNIPQDQKWNAQIKDIIFEKYKRLTFMSAVEKSDLIVWPETSFPGYLEDEPVMAAELRSVIRQSQTWVLVGAPTLGDLDRGLKFFNSAILYNPVGEEVRRYSKLHLVPFGEYVPFEPLFGFIRHFVEIGRFSPGAERTIFQISSRYRKNKVTVKFGALICYEDIFPGLVRGFCRDGADFLVNITNDAWFGKTAAPYQHAQASVFRAVENRVNVVRATNTGLSCFISPEGRILATVNDKGSEIFVTGHQGHDLALKKDRTFYTRFGDVFLLVPALLAFLAFRERSRQNAYVKAD